MNRNNDQIDAGIRVFAHDHRDDKAAREAQAFLNWEARQRLESVYRQILDGRPIIVDGVIKPK